jgi:hypothetical protein
MEYRFETALDKLCDQGILNIGMRMMLAEMLMEEARAHQTVKRSISYSIYCLNINSRNLNDLEPSVSATRTRA